MLVSDERRFVYVHIQKTGGISLEKVLRAQIPDLRQVGGRHEHLRRVPREISQDWDGYFKFCFVRNPWDRLVSWYSMIQREYRRLPWWKKRFQRRPLRMEIWNHALPYIHDFDRFVIECTGEVMDGGCLKSFVYSQADYIRTTDGRCAADFVGRFENFAADAEHVLRQVGLTAYEMPHENRSRHGHYRSYYNDMTRNIIARRFERDLEWFGYKFED